MINAYLLGQINPEGGDENTLERLKSINGVQEAHIVFGKFDIVAKIRSETPETLEKTVFEEIRKLPDIIKTQTLLVSE